MRGPEMLAFAQLPARVAIESLVPGKILLDAFVFSDQSLHYFTSNFG